VSAAAAPMSRARQALCGAYVTFALVALVACWRQNLLFASARGIGFADVFVEFWPALLANHATTSIAIDIFLFALAASVWMVVEARRLGIRFVWAYVVLGIFIAISFTFPLFLVARERRLHALSAERAGVSLTPGDLLGLALLAIPIVLGALWSLSW
jgi:hypothetical protein